MKAEIIKRLFARIYDRHRIRTFARAVADVVLGVVKENIRQHRQGTTGEHYPLTAFPDGEPPRVPFLRHVDDWRVEEDGHGFKVKPTQPWWAAHQRGVTIEARGRRPMAWKYDNRWFFARKVVLPRRNPVPGTKALERIIKQVEKEHANV